MPASAHIDEAGNTYLGVFGNFMLNKFDPDRNFLWQVGVPSNFPDNVTADEVQAILTDENGNVFFTGRHYGTGYPGPENYSNGDLQVIKAL